MESEYQPVQTMQQYKMSWTAYLRPFIVLLVVVWIGYLLTDFNVWVGGALIAFWLGRFIIQFLTVRSLVLSTDEQGVWVYSGIFPWSKGMSGVKWRDVEDAVYFSNFLSWALKSYTVRVGHRFTKSSEIVLPHVAYGNNAVQHINEFHGNFVATSPVEDIA